MNETDKLPPNDLEAEQATLGAMLIDERSVVEARSILPDGAFYREAHSIIYDAICTVADADQMVDIVTVAAELRRTGKLAACGGAEYLHALIGEVVTSAHTVRYASIVADAAILRQAIQEGSRLVREAYEHPRDVTGLLADHSRRMAALPLLGGRRSGAVEVGKDADRMLGRLEAAMEAAPHVSAVRTGIYELDRRMGGLQGHTLVCPRGQEKAGKSMFAMQALLASAQAFREEGQGRVAVAYVLEGLEIWQERALAWVGNFNSGVFTPRVSASAADRMAFTRAATEWRGLPLHLSGDLYDIDAILTDVKRINMAHRVGLVVIDYAQLIQGGAGDGPVQRAEDKANRLAALAGELGCPVIVPSQVTSGEGGRHAKWARAWDEAASLTFDVERGRPGDKREKWQTAQEGRLVLHGCRRRAPFGVFPVIFNLQTGRITYDETREGDR